MIKIHLKAPDCWINDPNGFIWYKGKYHLFYQCFPFSLEWGRMHWGHAVSDDLVTWEQKKIALYPSKKNDRSGCFSGSAVEYNDKMYIFYTGADYIEENPENINLCLNDNFISSQLMITSDDGLTFDNISDKKTIIPPICEKKIGDKVHTRDPKVWRGKDAWYMVLGSTVNSVGRLIFYKSNDLENWNYINYVQREDFGWMWECPDFFEINKKGVTIFSPMGFFKDGKEYDSTPVCMISSFDEETCKMELSKSYQIFDYGLDLYAPQSTTDESGERIVIAWARMPKSVDDKWKGMMCIPRVVDVKDNHIYFRPYKNVQNRFKKEISASQLNGLTFKLKTTLNNGQKINIGGYIIKRDNDKIITDRSSVFIVDGNYRFTSETPIIKEGNELEIFVDDNMIEIFINNGEYVITNIVYGLSNKITGENFSLYIP